MITTYYIAQNFGIVALANCSACNCALKGNLKANMAGVPLNFNTCINNLCINGNVGEFIEVATSLAT